MRANPGAAVKLCLGDLLVMGSNPETASGYEVFYTNSVNIFFIFSTHHKML